MSEEIKLLRRVPKTSDNTNGYEPVRDFAMDRPTILALGANDTLSSEKANGFAKTAQMLLTGSSVLFPEGVQIISAEYPKCYSVTNSGVAARRIAGAYVRESAGVVGYFSSPVQRIVEQQFLPLLADDAGIDSDGNAIGKKIALPELKRRLRNVNIVAHSYGGMIAEQIFNAVHRYMEDIGYTEVDINDAMAQISLLAVGGAGMLRPSGVTALHILNKSDTGVQSFYTWTGAGMHNMKDFPVGETSIGGENGRELVVILDDSQKVTMSKYSEKYFLAKHLSRLQNHGIKDYMNFSYDMSSGKILPSHAAIFLAQSVNNSLQNNTPSAEFAELPTARDLMKDYLHPFHGADGCSGKLPYQVMLLKQRFEYAKNNSTFLY